LVLLFVEKLEVELVLQGQFEFLDHKTVDLREGRRQVAEREGFDRL
jgi:hypothetical protein